jgi:hypothetical protein
MDLAGMMAMEPPRVMHLQEFLASVALHSRLDTVSGDESEERQRATGQSKISERLDLNPQKAAKSAFAGRWRLWKIAFSDM